ncbi:MAG: hypothetical protein ACPGSD_12030 [Flavobacteriales bacterium]|jgi:hypothetical protein
MLYNTKHIDLFKKYIQKEYLELPFKSYFDNQKTGVLQINLLTEKTIFLPLSTYTKDDKGFFVFGNMNISTSIIICNDISYFIKTFKTQLDLDYTSIFLTPKNLLPIHYKQLGSLLSLNKAIHTFYKQPFDRFLLDAFLHKGLSLDKEGNYIYNKKIISPSLSKTEINKITNLRTIIKHL